MTTRQEYLRWMMGEEVAGLPDNLSLGMAKAGATVDLIDPSRPSAGNDSDYRRVQRIRFSVLEPKVKGTLLVDAELGFGKHRGKRLSELVELDPSYLAFLMDPPPAGDDEDEKASSIITDELRGIAREWFAKVPRATKRSRFRTSGGVRHARRKS